MNFVEASNNLMFDNCINVGVILKPHATKGQFTANINFFLDDLKEESIFVEIDNFLIPFFIDYSMCNISISPAILKFTNINTVEKISELKGKNLFLPKEHINNFEIQLSNWETYVENYLIIDNKLGKIGEIIEFVENKKNPLFVVKNNFKETLIPLNVISVINIDHENKSILLEISSKFVIE